MFSDADLLGIPLRVVVSPKTLAENKAEFRTRSCRDSEKIDLAAIPVLVKSRVAEELAKFV